MNRPQQWRPPATSYHWLSADPPRKAHLVMYDEWHVPYTLCGNAAHWVLIPAGSTPRCKRCTAMAKRLKVEVRA